MTWAVMESPEMNSLEVGTLDFLIQGRMGGVGSVQIWKIPGCICMPGVTLAFL